MKLIIKIGLKPNGRIGVNIVEVDKYDTSVRACNHSYVIKQELIKNFGELYTENKLPYVGYEIMWKTKRVMLHGIGIADIDYKEKNNCPPQIIKFGRKVYQTLAMPTEEELAG